MSNSLEVLIKQFPGKVFLHTEDVALACGWAQKTVNNLLWLDRFPIPAARNSARDRFRLFHISDVADYLESRRPSDSKKTSRALPVSEEQAVAAPGERVKRGPGRPRKNREGGVR